MFLSRHELREEMKRIVLALICTFSFLMHPCSAKDEYQIDFNDVPVIELIRFVSRISEVNFLFDHRELGFSVTLSSGKPISAQEVVQALIRMLRMNGFAVSNDGNYFVIHRYSKEDLKNGVHMQRPSFAVDHLVAGEIPSIPVDQLEFATYKIRYHQGDEIEGALKKIASDMKNRKGKPTKLIEAIESIQWVKVTNSFFFSGDQETVDGLDKLIRTLDVPRKQVFIEVLVIETDTKKSTEFGLQWLGGGRFKDKISFGAGNFSPKGNSPLATVGQEVNSGAGLTGLNQIPLGRGFDFGVIGDIILHKGKTFLTLGSLVSALEMDGDTNIVLNQKLITQDNRNSSIFVGDNIPFTGSVVQTIGSSQQTSANIEYRDVGVSLSITPMLGDDNIITLDIDQEITEAIDDPMVSNSEVEGIRTTKTNMNTYAHVPDNHFLVLSGMVRNARSFQRAGIPCLGGLPVIGAVFSKNKRMSERRNVLIFVRPHIINTFQDYRDITQAQEEYHQVALQHSESVQ
ncbi:MAG: Type II secretion system protein D [Chlamydiae bacterium]|nr:Type II secretion system protein D [Chlamydiota bacterium]